MVIVAAVGAAAVGSVASAAIGSSAAKSAANTQAEAAQQAAELQAQQYQQTRSDLLPYNVLGQNAAGQLANLTGTEDGGNPLTSPLTAPFQPTMAQLEQTPGYQFTLDQGLKATQNSYAAQGLGSSGAAEKGGINYAEGLASTTYQQQFNNYLAQNQQIYNMLNGQIGTGENAAAQTGVIGSGLAQSQASLITGGAAASAAGQVGSANAIASGINGIGNAALLYGLNSGSLFGGSTGGDAGASVLGAGSAGFGAGIV